MKKFRTIASRGVALLLALAMAGPLFTALIHAEPGADGAFCGFSEHIHGPECVKQVWPCGQEADPDHQHVATCWFEEKELTCQQEYDYHTHDIISCDYAPVLTCENTDPGHEHQQNTCYQSMCIIPAFVEHTHTDACWQTVVKNLCGKHVHDESCGEPQTVGCGLEEHGHTESCFVEPVPVYTFTEGGVSVTGPLPEQTTLSVTPVDPSTLPALPGQLAFAYDITPMVEGEKVQPDGAVTVTIPYAVPAGMCLEAWHILSDGTIEGAAVTDNGDGTVTITAGSFSTFVGTLVVSGSTTDGKIGDTIYFDLAADTVTINASTYKGKVYKTENGTTSMITVTGTHNANNKYYVYQSTTKNRSTTGLDAEGRLTLPDYDRVIYDGKAWGDYVTKNTDPTAVALTWASLFSGNGAIREGTANYVKITGASTYNITVEDLWSTENQASTGRATGGIAFVPSKGGKSYITLLGDNRFGNVHYLYKDTNLINLPDADGFVEGTGILFRDGESGTVPASMTVVSYDGKSNHYNAVIGGNDSSDHSSGIIIESGVIYAGARGTRVDNNGNYTGYTGSGQVDNCSAIGGGGNGRGVVTIHGGKVTAVTSSTGAAIGGGIGESQAGGIGYVTIKGGEVFAYNNSYVTFSSSVPYAVPAAAIGGASSREKSGADATVIITGGTVYAQSVGGTAIGGGSSVKAQGGTGTVTIGGDAVVTARSIAGDVNKYNPNSYTASSKTYTYKQQLAVGVSIGGGTAGELGSADTHVGGNAVVIVEEDSTAEIKTGSVGGGACNRVDGKGNIGYARVYIHGGTIQGQVVMAAGATDNCIFEMTGGTLDNSTKTDDFVFIQPEKGGAVYMDDNGGTATISGGTIQNCTSQNGGAIYMTAGTLNLSGDARIQDCSAAENGGAIWMGKDGEITGTANISGGTVQRCSAVNGGAIYMGGGTLTMTAGTITGNAASNNGGAVYLQQGTLTMSGGSISKNGILGETSTKNGGGIYMGGGMLTLSGVQADETTFVPAEIHDNEATETGGGIWLGGGELHLDGAKVTENYAGSRGGGAYVQDGLICMSSGAVDGNEAGSDGGGMYVSSASQAVVVDILSGSVSGNSSAGRGGALAIVGQDKKVTLTIGVNENHFDADEKPLLPFDHDHCHISHTHENCTLTHVSCPVVNKNTATGEGGAVFISGSTAEGLETELNIYCVTAAANDGTGEKSDFMKVEGGAVQVDSAKKAYGDTEITEKGDHCHGQAHIDNSLHIVGGQVDLYGDTENPSFGDSITVDIPESAGTEQWFRDHRYADPEEWFRVVYHADYTDAILGKVTTYIAYQFPTMTDDQPTVHKIKAAIFSREGYRIRGWIGKDQDVTDPDPDTEYEVASDWQLTQDLPALTNSTNTLHLYAVWDVYGYYIAFDPNVPTGESYGTDMETVFRGYEAEEALPKCTFARSGYRFTGWMDGIGRAYEDGQVVTQLTEQDLATVTLYAQWEKCNHVDHCTHTYSVTGGGTQLLRSCSCGGQDLYATIHVPNVVYDGNVHYTDTEAVIWDSDWPESDRSAVLFRKDSLDGESVMPVNAGTYVCYINRECAGLYAAVTYQILKAPQPAPDPVSFAASGSTLTVSAPDSGERGTALLYKLIYQTTEGAKTLDWQAGNSFTLPENYTSYQVYAMYAGSDNYLPSPEGRSDDVYFYQDATGTKISIQCADGIDYTAAGNSVLGGFHIITSPEAGWYLTDDFTVKILSQTGGDKDATVGPENEGTKWSSYVMKGIPTGATIVVSITGAKQSPVLEAKVMPGQQFGEVTDQTTTIVRDSSFTAWFSVEYYDGDVYAVPELTFNRALPEGTALILTDGNYSYWHHTVEIPTGEIPLTSFAPMGSDDPVLSGTSFAGQFVVDFSRCAAVLSADETLTVTLRADKMGKTNAPEWQSLLEVKSIALADVNFGLSVAAGTTEGGLTQILEYSYQPGADSASRWEGKGAALRLTPSPNTPLPPDAALHLVTARGTSVHLPTGDSFLLPLERLPWGQNKVGTAAITLQSALFPKTAASYIFTAELLISPTGVSTSPEGYMTVETLNDVTFSKAVTMEPALVIESDEQTTGADNIPYTVRVAGMERGAEITIYLQQKNERGTYMDTAQSYRWQYDGTETGSVLRQTMSLELYKTAPGSYRLWAQAVYDGHILLEVPYYFLIVR